MMQWINILWNNSFINLMRLPLLCEKIGALAIVELGLTAGRPAGQQAGRPLGRQKCCKGKKL